MTHENNVNYPSDVEIPMARTKKDARIFSGVGSDGRDMFLTRKEADKRGWKQLVFVGYGSDCRKQWVPIDELIEGYVERGGEEVL